MSLKTVLGVIPFLALLHNPSQAVSAVLPPAYSVALAWDGSLSPDVAGYRVYYGAASGDYTNSVVVGNATANTIPGLAGGVTYFFAVKAYDTNGFESGYSNEIRFVPGLPTVRLGVTAAGDAVLKVKGLIGRTYDILATEGFAGWSVVGTVTLGASGSGDFTDPNATSFPKRFYRTQLKP